MTEDRLLGAVEAGGTKFRCAVVSPDLTIADSRYVLTTDPDTTLATVVEFFERSEPAAALGIASFGPVDLDPDSPGYGSITDTPKPGWPDAPILGRLSEALGVPAAIQTDVEAAAVAEQGLGPEPRPRRLAYVTVGTGIGAAVAVDGRPWRGRHHSELGHIPVRRAGGDDYPGCCPFHRDCLEGMACGPAIAERWGVDPPDAGGRDDIWQLEAAYLAQLVRVLAYSFAPDRVVFGGGVGAHPGLAETIRAAARTELAGYADYSTGDDRFVTAPALGNYSGLLGAALLARSLLHG
ncbi:MAG: ROK family protein [Acidimicrobiaceae bacterium]|nr:ROK family protein [Acidimicrobiaceae bacterium]MYE76002.1 ROK family protein [Acidimicrobiaceae bacterium]MYH44769.1 ROK family protein [Acidimicrobiaceae bacterium]MYJ42995.1 ROK family protein [Acidimicrobiaceae bacterium]MYK73469.1 ROK family protein [Acidimicrobiaceae bacterium]